MVRGLGAGAGVGGEGEYSAFLVLLWLYLGVKLTWKGVMAKAPQMTLRSVTADRWYLVNIWPPSWKAFQSAGV